MSYKNYTDKDIEEAVKNSISLAETLKKLNLVCAGGNYSHLKHNIARLNLDTSVTRKASQCLHQNLPDFGCLLFCLFSPIWFFSKRLFIKSF